MSGRLSKLNVNKKSKETYSAMLIKMLLLEKLCGAGASFDNNFDGRAVWLLLLLQDREGWAWKALLWEKRA